MPFVNATSTGNGISKSDLNLSSPLSTAQVLGQYYLAAVYGKYTQPTGYMGYKYCPYYNMAALVVQDMWNMATRHVSLGRTGFFFNHVCGRLGGFKWNFPHTTQGAGRSKQPVSCGSMVMPMVSVALPGC